MDILIIVPKKEHDHFWNPISEDDIAWWTLHHKPKYFELGDTVRFQLAGEVVAEVVPTETKTGVLTCEETDREWEGFHLIWPGQTLKRLDPKLPGKKMTRGFTYWTPQ